MIYFLYGFFIAMQKYDFAINIFEKNQEK